MKFYQLSEKNINQMLRDSGINSDDNIKKKLKYVFEKKLLIYVFDLDEENDRINIESAILKVFLKSNYISII
jgi:hypothetical protein